MAEAELCPGSKRLGYFIPGLNLYECDEEGCIACFDPDELLAGHRIPDHKFKETKPRAKRRKWVQPLSTFQACYGGWLGS